jgi:NADPH-dependent 2,4-dienoyl-CoA reductase/sulfur reductase-like enzyme/rhodanese-related sulfurtransferase
VSQARQVIVVGASAAGLRCACRLARLEPQTTVTVIEARTIFSYAACGLPYALGGEVEADDALRRTSWGRIRDPQYFQETKGVNVRAGWRAVEIDAAGGRLQVTGPAGERESLAYDDLVLATGAHARRLPGQPAHPRVTALHVFEDVEPIRRGLVRGDLEHVAIIGAGLVGCETAEALRVLWGARVTLIEAGATPLPAVLDAELGAGVARRLEGGGVGVRAGAVVRSLVPNPTSVVVTDSGGETVADAVIVAVGAAPDVDLAVRAGVRLGPTGAMAVDARCATNLPHVWAVGDCAEVRDAISGQAAHAPLGGVANRHGRTLGEILAGRPVTCPAVAGAMAVRVFETNVAAVGWTRTRAERHGVRARTAWISAEDKAHYWPEARLIHLALVYEPGSRRVLGVQALGAGDVAKRIDVATQLILRGATLDDFAAIEHAYAPPYAPAVDPLAVVAWVALNQEEGIEAEVPTAPLDGRHVLDLREPAERQSRPVPASDVTPVAPAVLREQPGAAAGAADPLLVCAHGARAAEAVRVLQRQGISARYLGGGLSFTADSQLEPHA